MKNILFIIILTLLFTCCSTNKVEEIAPIEETPIVEVENIEEQVDESEELIVHDEPDVEIIVQTVQSEEYVRSVSALNKDTISEAVFTEDKQTILDIIKVLNEIMVNKDYNEWVKYLTPDSVKYWSDPKNLQLISQRLPIKNYKLKNLKEYFESIFILSRKGRVVDEIRYVSPTTVKAVQYKKEQDIIYFFFEKINDIWLLKLDTSL